MHDVFISYSTKDTLQAEKVRNVLEQNGIPCWMAPRDIPGGSNYAGEIPKAIRGCQVFVLMLSENAQSSLWVVKELDTAVNCGKVIIPLMLEDCPLNDEFNFLLTGAQRYAAYCRSAEVLNTLVERIRAITGHTETAAAEKTLPPQPEEPAPVREKDAAEKEVAPVVVKAKPRKVKPAKDKIPFTFGKTEALAIAAIPALAVLSGAAYLLGIFRYYSVRNAAARLEGGDTLALAVYMLLGALLGAALWWEWIRFRHKEAAQSTVVTVCPSCGGKDLAVSNFRTHRLTRGEKLTLIAVPLCILAGLLAEPFTEILLRELLDVYWLQSSMRNGMLHSSAVQGLAVGLWLSNAWVRRSRRRKGLHSAVCRCKACRSHFLPVRNEE